MVEFDWVVSLMLMMLMEAKIDLIDLLIFEICMICKKFRILNFNCNLNQFICLMEFAISFQLSK